MTDVVPTTPGFYLAGHSGCMVLDNDGMWRGTYSNATPIDPENLPSDLARVITPQECADIIRKAQTGSDAIELLYELAPGEFEL